ncbi:MAG: FAD-dependent oxidoreductase [Pseudomonadota bacterium]
MPFETQATAPKRVAVIGGGISGMGAAHLLARQHNVTLFEEASRLGGHARTIVAGKRGDQPVDTGFIVFNYANYPYLAALFHELGVPVAKSSMSFAGSFRGGRFEYALNSLDTLFSQRRNIVSPRFLRMVRDIVHFNRHALAAANDPEMTISALLDKLGTGDWFRDYYLLPFSGAIWSTPKEQILDFPAAALVRFFKNHALLSHTGQHQWYTVKGGSIEYVNRLEASLTQQGVDLRLRAEVTAVSRRAGSVTVRCKGGGVEGFDEVVFATHSDDTLRLLSDANPTERAALGAIKYQPNEAVLHADTSLMPKRRRAWSSWCYTETADKTDDRIDLTYWMNSLQPIPMDDPMFVTLNATQRIREDLIYDTCTFRHPVYDLGALKAQDVLRAHNGTNRTWFCGAWMKDGFHEDGLASAVDVVEAMGRDAGMLMAAE